jgi:hypothetical protein
MSWLVPVASRRGRGEGADGATGGGGRLARCGGGGRLVRCGVGSSVNGEGSVRDDGAALARGEGVGGGGGIGGEKAGRDDGRRGGELFLDGAGDGFSTAGDAFAAGSGGGLDAPARPGPTRSGMAGGAADPINAGAGGGR